jgi:hypothetical protein
VSNQDDLILEHSQHSMKSNLNRTMLVGVVLGFAGAALDFISGYSVGSQSMMSVDDMGIKSTVYNTSALGWGIGISVLGVALVITAILSLTRLGSARMGSFGLLMIVFGAIMFVIGGSMYLGIVPMMAYSDLSSAGMFTVGALMVVNGRLMSRTRSMM